VLWSFGLFWRFWGRDTLGDVAPCWAILDAEGLRKRRSTAALQNLADTALRLSHYFDTRPAWWLDLQTHYDLALAADETEEQIARKVSRCSMMPLPEPVST
jgi:hypothetical protein